MELVTSNISHLVLKLGIELFCVTEAMINEASVDGDVGMIAVAHVIKSRVSDNSGEFPMTACKVVYQPSSDPAKPWACHFSYTCDGKVRYLTKRDEKEFLRVAELARKVGNEESLDITMGSMYYTRCGIKMQWMDDLQPTVKIGKHCYYKRKTEV